jgi:hypothetical protein
VAVAGSSGGIVRQLWRWLVAVVVISKLLLVVFVVKVLAVRETLHFYVFMFVVKALPVRETPRLYIFVNRVARCVCCAVLLSLLSLLELCA